MKVGGAQEEESSIDSLHPCKDPVAAACETLAALQVRPPPCLHCKSFPYEHRVQCTHLDVSAHAQAQAAALQDRAARLQAEADTAAEVRFVGAC